MSRYSTPQEVKKEHLEKLGPNLGPVYHALWNECAWLHIKWQQYEELYGTNPERIDLLNNAAPVFFLVVEDSLWQDVFLHLSALTDSPKSREKKNLTLLRLPDLVESGPLKQELTNAVEKAREATKFARDWRNRKYAHRDLALAIGNGPEPLTPASRNQVRAAIDAVCEVVRKVHKE